MFIKFIAHAGIYIEEGGFSILVDPWFSDSTLDNPIIEGFSGKKTIDFQIPKTKEKIEDFKPNCILISHFHSHHAPLVDVNSIILNSDNIIVAYPILGSNQLVTDRLLAFNNVSSRPTGDGDVFDVGCFTIKALAHTVSGHMAWFIKSATGSILHIADARVNKNYDMNTLDEVWNKFSELYPSMVFISAGRNTLRIENKETYEKDIKESTCFSPIQASKLLKKIKPKAVSLIGIYNHSIWKNCEEFTLEACHIENEFNWSLSWLARETKFIRMFPGHSFGINDESLPKKVDTYIK